MTATVDPVPTQGHDLSAGGTVSDGDGAVNVAVSNTSSTPGEPARERGLPPIGPAAPRRQCELVSFPSPGTAGGQDLAGLPAQMNSDQIAAHRPATLVPGQTYARYCTEDGMTWDLVGGFVFQPGNPTTPGPAIPVVAPRVLAQQALANVHVPDPRVGTAPPYRKDSLVGIDTWQSVEVKHPSL